MRCLASTIQCLALLIATQAAAAPKVVVVLDVSGSMKHYGNWQTDAVTALQAILNGETIPGSWRVRGNREDFGQYHLSPQGNVILIQFGTVQHSAEFPFFEHISPPLSVEMAMQQFPTDPQRYSEGSTNSSLAEMVAAKLGNDTNGPSLVIMVSDFLKDIELSDQQRDYVNQAQNQYAMYTVATLSRDSNPLLQIKLLKFVPQAQTSGTGTGSEPEGVLHLMPAKYNAAANNIGLAWRYEGNSTPLKYDVTVREARHGNLIFSKDNLAGTSLVYPNEEGGSFRWVVTAHLEHGKEIRQSAAFNVPEKSSAGGGIAILIVAIGGILGLLAFLLRKYGPPDALGFLGKKKHSNNIDI